MPTDFWKNKRVLVTGGEGFLGRHLVRRLKEKNAEVFVPSIKDYDLRKLDACLEVTKNKDIVIHLAGVVGGIEFNKSNPGKLFYDNLMLNTNMMEAARQMDVKKFVGISSACAYPEDALVPFKEEHLLDGPPEETNRPYGYAKRMLAIQGKSYNQQYGMNAITLVLFNIYGPGDKFDLRTSHVIPALIMKCFQNGKLVVFGDGTPSRSFLYVEDAVEGIILATEKYNSPEPINIGTSEEITIKELLVKVTKYTRFKGEVTWDTTKPNGQPRRCADITKAEKLLGFKAKTTLDEGLKKTIEWYKNEKKSNTDNTEL